MINQLKENLWSQFGASIDMLENAIRSAPNDLLQDDKRFFFMAYHALVFLDYYLTLPPSDFSAGLPFTLTPINEIPPEALDDVVPNRFYSKPELLDYLDSSRKKCHHLISTLTETKLNDQFIEEPASGSMNYSLLEILLYNMRHTQHHAAQLNLILRNTLGDAPRWVGRAKS
jgi:hypothetical protein